MRLTALLLVMLLAFLQTAGWRLLPGWLHEILSVLGVVGIVILALGKLYDWRYEDERVTAADIAFARIGLRVGLASLVLSTAAALLTVVLWEWRPGVDFDVLGVLWLLQNAPALGLIFIFGTIALCSLAVVFRNLAMARR